MCLTSCTHESEMTSLLYLKNLDIISGCGKELMYGLEDKHYLSRKMDTNDWEGLFEKLEKQGLMFNFLKKIGIMLLTPDNNFFSNCLFWVTVKKKK